MAWAPYTDHDPKEIILRPQTCDPKWWRKIGDSIERPPNYGRLSGTSEEAKITRGEFEKALDENRLKDSIADMVRVVDEIASSGNALRSLKSGVCLHTSTSSSARVSRATASDDVGQAHWI